MARYKTIDTSPRFLALDQQRQLVAGTFEHALDWLVDHELDLTGFNVRYRETPTARPTTHRLYYSKSCPRSACRHGFLKSPFGRFTQFYQLPEPTLKQ